ncbi:MAG: glycosyltransferase [Promethearchaeota archaeon]
MKIGFLYLHAPNESMGSIYRIRNLCLGLAQLGHKCFIFTPFEYPINWGNSIKFINILSKTTLQKISPSLYRFLRKILYAPRISLITILNSHFFNFTTNLIAKNLHKEIENKKLDLDVLIGESELAGLILIKLKNGLKFPIITDFQNFWPEELVENGSIRRTSRKYKELLNLVDNVIKKSNLIITPSNLLTIFLIKNFSDKSNNHKIKTIINGGTPLLEKPLIKKGPPKIINAGMVVSRSNLNFFLDSLPHVYKEFPDLRVYITRKGERLKSIMKRSKKMNLNINFYWKENYDDYIKFLSSCNLGIVTSSYELTRRLGFVTKIYDYFSVGVPVVGNYIGGWTNIIKQENVGLLSSGNSMDLAEKIIYLLNNQDLCYKLGMNAINLLKSKYNCKNTARKLVDVIISL